MRDAVRNKERRKRRRAHTQEPGTDLRAWAQAPATMVFVLKPGVSLDKAGFLKFLHPMLEQELRTLRSNIGAREVSARS